MKEKLLEIIPEFICIEDRELAAKCVDVWLDAMSIGGWTMEDLVDMPFTDLIKDCPVNFPTHVSAVTQVALKSANILAGFYKSHPSINLDYIAAGGLLHDVGKLLEYQRKEGTFKKSEMGRLVRHPFSGVGLAMKHGLPDEVIHIIATHAKEGNHAQRSPEAIIVHHADFINFECFYNPDPRSTQYLNEK